MYRLEQNNKTSIKIDDRLATQMRCQSIGRVYIMGFLLYRKVLSHSPTVSWNTVICIPTYGLVMSIVYGEYRLQ